MVTRRHVMIAGLSFAATAAGFGAPALAAARPKVVIIGGGAGGASVLRRLVADTNGALDITLVEPQTVYTTCYYSNLYLGNVHPLDLLQWTFEEIAKLPGVTVARDRAAAIDREKQEVRLESGARLPYDRLVVSPGIALDYESVPGWSKDAEERMPHAWIAGPQTALLKRQIDAVPDGGLVVMVAPPNPYRCPPGPYERVSMIAKALTEAGKTKARIIIIDPKTVFSKQPLFQQGWEKYYPGMIEWQSPQIHGGLQRVDPDTMSVATNFETYTGAALVNVIPRQTAGRIAAEAGLSEANGFCPIDPFTMKSKLDENVVVLGDASIAGDMPKSAFAANNQAQVAAQALAADLLERAPEEAAFRNKCWSLLAENDSVYVEGRYEPTAEKIAQVESGVSGMDDTPEIRRQNYDDSAGWYAGLTSSLYV